MNHPYWIEGEPAMQKRATLSSALVLIGIGAWFLAVALIEPLRGFARGEATWPLQIIGIGAYLALIGLITWQPGLLVPACIVAGVGGILTYQNASGNWASWAYAWALIPASTGLGIILSGLLKRETGVLTGGGWLVINSLAAFFIFGAFLGGGSLFSNYWPVLLIVVGVILLGRGSVRRR
jgi:hypothetical protein